MNATARSRYFAEKLFMRGTSVRTRSPKTTHEEQAAQIARDTKKYLASGKRVHAMPGTPETPMPRHAYYAGAYVQWSPYPKV